MPEQPRKQSRRRLGRKVLYTFVGLFILYSGASYLLASLFIHAYPKQVVAPTGLDVESVQLLTDDGIAIAAWVLETDKQAKGTVLLFHGKGGNRQPEKMRMLQTAGFRSLAIDLRAHGESGGDRSSFGWFERKDVAAAIRYARKRWPEDGIAGWGHSLGGAALIYAWEESRHLDALVIESVYSSIERAFDNRFRQRLPGFLLPLACGVKCCTSWRLSISMNDLRPEHWIKELPAERLLITRGALDKRVDAVDFERLLAAAPGASQLVVPGVAHGELYSAGDANDLRAVLDFIEAACRQ